MNTLDALISKRSYELKGLGNFYVFRKNDFISRKIKKGVIWDSHLIHVFEKYIRKESNVIDAGAHIGIHTIRFARLCNPGKVYSFEAHPTTYKILKKNIKLNNVKNIKAYNLGLSDNKTKTKIRWIRKTNIGQSYLDNNPLALPESKGLAEKEQNNIKLRTIDSYKFKNVSFIKIDVEGYERKVVKGTINTIKNYHPVIQIECWKNLEGEIIRVEDEDTVLNDLKKLSYQIEYIGSGEEADFLAIPE